MTTIGEKTEKIYRKNGAKKRFFAQKQSKKGQKEPILSEKILHFSLGPGGTEFKSPHFDHKKTVTF